MRVTGYLLGAAAMAAATGFTGGASQATTYYTDFSTIGTSSFTGTYSDGGITIAYVGTYSDIWTTSQPAAPSGYSWYPDGGGTGYSDITLTGGGTFNSIELLAGSGWYGGGANLLYQALDGATVVATGNLGSLLAAFGGLQTYPLSTGGPFTEFRVQGPLSGVFDANTYEALAIGSITIKSVPEPSAWAMLTLGFAGLAFAGYRARRATAAAA